MEERTLRRWCIFIMLRPDTNNARLIKDGPVLMKLVEGFSNGEWEHLCRSNDRLLLGYFIKSKMLPDMMSAEFERCPGSLDRDHMIVFEVGGKQAATNGFSRALTWLQRH